MEWKLFDDAAPPEFFDPDYLAGLPWMDLAHQPGFPERSRMVLNAARLILGIRPGLTITELGCGDGSILAGLHELPGAGPAWGYDANASDVEVARRNSLDVMLADIVAGHTLPDKAAIQYGELVVACEVLEHLHDPLKFLQLLPADVEIGLFSSPSKETGGWHNQIHAWAWDMDGYARLIERAGWEVVYHTEVDGGLNTFDGVTGSQAFQVVVAVQPVVR